MNSNSIENLKKFNYLNSLIFISTSMYIFKHIYSFPSIVPIHFTRDGIADGFGSKYILLTILIFYPIFYVFFNVLLRKFATTKNSQIFLKVLETMTYLIFTIVSYDMINNVISNL